MSELTREQIEDIREDGPALITAGAWIALCDMALRTLDAEARADRLQQEAEIHAGEARTANHTIAETYQLCTGAAGEPGNWSGAQPVRRLLARAEKAEARIRELEAALRPFVDAFGSQDWYRRRRDVNVLSEMLCLPVPITPDDIERACKELAAPAPPDSEPSEGADLQWARTSDGRIFVGYNPRSEEGGFHVVSWAPDWINLGAITQRLDDTAPDSEPAEGAGGGYQRVLIDAANNVLDCLARPWELTTADLVAIRQSLQAVVHGEAPTYADDTTEQQDAMLERREALDEMLDELKQFADVGSERTADPVGARSRIGELARTLRKALSRTSDEGTGCVVPEAVKVLPNMYRRKGWDLAADMLEAAIAEQGGQPEHGESDARD